MTELHLKQQATVSPQPWSDRTVIDTANDAATAGDRPLVGQVASSMRRQRRQQEAARHGPGAGRRTDATGPQVGIAAAGRRDQPVVMRVLSADMLKQDGGQKRHGNTSAEQKLRWAVTGATDAPP